jgi:hypothetical protein
LQRHQCVIVKILFRNLCQGFGYSAIQEAALNSTPVIKTKLKSLNFMKEIRNHIAENVNLEENGISQEIYMIKSPKQS